MASEPTQPDPVSPTDGDTSDDLLELPQHRLAEHIRIERRQASPELDLYIDGALFPYMIASDPIKVSLGYGVPGTVTITLLAEHIEVTDRYIEGAAAAHGLNHTHEP